MSDLGKSVVVSAGNVGGEADRAPTSPADACNTIAVGGSSGLHYDFPWPGSTEEPPSSGRIKPDTVAPAVSITTPSRTWEGVNPDDLDLTGTGFGDPAFDVTGDGQTDIDDIIDLATGTLGTAMGDANPDRNINLIDLGLLADSFGRAGGWANSGLNGGGLVNIVDLETLATSFGVSASASAGLLVAIESRDADLITATHATAIPEPATLTLLLVSITVRAPRIR